MAETARIAPLKHGDRLTRDEFERRYNTMPSLKKAELIEGVVHMPSPVRAHHHANPHYQLIGWASMYTNMTPGIYGFDNSARCPQRASTRRSTGHRPQARRAGTDQRR